MPPCAGSSRRHARGCRHDLDRMDTRSDPAATRRLGCGDIDGGDRTAARRGQKRHYRKVPPPQTGRPHVRRHCPRSDPARPGKNSQRYRGGSSAKGYRDILPRRRETHRGDPRHDGRRTEAKARPTAEGQPGAGQVATTVCGQARRSAGPAESRDGRCGRSDQDRYDPRSVRSRASRDECGGCRSCAE